MVQLAWIKRCITFTEKTRYLFEINKGIPQGEADRSPYLVNRAVSPEDRRIPFSNMIYLGDGLTDIPCLSLVQKNGGVAFGVFEVSNEGKAKRALTDFLQQGRVLGMYAPRYGPDDDLGSLLRATVATFCSRIEIDSRQAYSG